MLVENLGSRVRAKARQWYATLSTKRAGGARWEAEQRMKVEHLVSSMGAPS